MSGKVKEVHRKRENKTKQKKRKEKKGYDIRMKKLIYMGIILSLIAVIMPGASASASASDAEEQGNVSRVLGRVVVPQEEVFAAVSNGAANGVVEGSGVRLRKRPSSNSTILGLMNYGEYVDVDYSESTTNWYYLWRLKNNTRGYAKKSYIYLF